MKQANLEQSLCALMDGQADELEMHRILQQLDDPQVRACWERLQVARSVLRKEDFVPQVDLSQRISQALAEEQQEQQEQQEQASSKKQLLPPAWSRLAVAASVTFAVLVGAKLVLDQQPDTAAPVMAASQQQAPANATSPVVLASYGATAQQHVQVQLAEDDSTLWYREQLPRYLRQHNSHATAPGIETSLPYARAATVEGH